MYKTDASYKGKYIWTVFGVRKGFRNKCTFICEASNRLTKNKCRLQREVHRTLEIAQTLMQRVVLLCSYAFVAKKGRPTNFLKRVRQNSPKKTFDSHGTGVNMYEKFWKKHFIKV